MSQDPIDEISRRLTWIAGALFLIYLASGITMVAPGDVALILRLGRLSGGDASHRIYDSGLLFALPFPIDRVIRIPVRQEQELELNEFWSIWRGAQDGSFEEKIDPTKQGYALTGDQNILRLRFTAKFRIVDPVAFALRSADPRRIVESSVTAAAADVLAGMSVNDALRMRTGASSDQSVDSMESGGGLGIRVAQLAQSRIELIKIGVQLSSVEFKEVTPVAQVVELFRRVQTARVEKETSKQDALGFQKSSLPKAESERDSMIQDARAQSTALQAAASAEASLFAGIMKEYRINPTMVRARLKREASEEMFAKAARRYFVPSVNSGGVKLLLNDKESSGGK